MKAFRDTRAFAPEIRAKTKFGLIQTQASLTIDYPEDIWISVPWTVYGLTDGSVSVLFNLTPSLHQFVPGNMPGVQPSIPPRSKL